MCYRVVLLQLLAQHVHGASLLNCLPAPDTPASLHATGFCHWPQVAWRKPDGTRVPSRANFTSLATPNAVGKPRRLFVGQGFGALFVPECQGSSRQAVAGSSSAAATVLSAGMRMVAVVQGTLGRGASLQVKATTTLALATMNAADMTAEDSNKGAGVLALCLAGTRSDA